MERTVLITGVAGGIGRGIAQVFAEVGWFVFGVDRQIAQDVPGVNHFIHADISNIEQSQGIFQQVAQTKGSLDALINNAAVQVAKALVDTTPEEWDMVMASNLRSVYLAIRHAYPLMKGRDSAIVNIGSVHSVATSVNMAAYAASKGALHALTRAVALELARDLIRVNTVLPGATDTPMLRAGLNRGHVSGSEEEKIAQLASKHVMGRIGQPYEIAQTVLFLADHQRSSFMTGQSIVVDGGATARLSTE